MFTNINKKKLWGAGAYPGGSGPPPKKFEPQLEHGSNFFGGGPDPPGYAHVEVFNAILRMFCCNLIDNVWFSIILFVQNYLINIHCL